jgi:hypothetical protein
MTHDWLIMLRGEQGSSNSVHYVSEAEAARIASVAKSMRCTVSDGPRPLTERERAPAADRAGKPQQ